ncbi:hypothetical protein GCM10025762_12540 [Haloechinothrix salitolerans]
MTQIRKDHLNVQECPGPGHEPVADRQGTPGLFLIINAETGERVDVLADRTAATL